MLEFIPSIPSTPSEKSMADHPPPQRSWWHLFHKEILTQTYRKDNQVEQKQSIKEGTYNTGCCTSFVFSFCDDNNIHKKIMHFLLAEN